MTDCWNRINQDNLTFMPTKEELNRIFEEALQTPEESFDTPALNQTPATAVAAAPAAESVEVQLSASASAAEASGEENVKAHASVNETDPEFGALLEEREGRLKKKSSRVRWAVNLLFLGLLGGTVTAFAVSPELRGKTQTFVGSLKEGVEDVKMMGNGTENYDEALEQVAARNDQINNASRMMGVDAPKLGKEKEAAEAPAE
jgi:hypothetical protein